MGLVVKVVAEEIDWHDPLERDPKGGKRHGEPKAELPLELVLEGVGGPRSDAGWRCGAHIGHCGAESRRGVSFL